MRLFRSQSQEEDVSSDDGDQTLDLSVSRDGDGQVIILIIFKISHIIIIFNP